MSQSEQGALSLFAVVPPGLEPVLAAELADLGYTDVNEVAGGIELSGDWEDVAAINIRSAIASRVLVRVGSFRAHGLRDLERRARRIDWQGLVRAGQPVRTKITCRKSRIYHTGAADERLRRAMAEVAGGDVMQASAEESDGVLTVMLRIERDRATVSVDASGEHLHRRGYRQQIAHAPLRETLAAALLRLAGWRESGSDAEPLVDPMCGSGTLVIEAARRARGIAPGSDRRFAFEEWGVVDESVVSELRKPRAIQRAGPIIIGSDRDAGAIEASIANAERAGVADIVGFECKALSYATAPSNSRGLLLTNPPWGDRLSGGDLRNLYARLGQLLNGPFAGWRLDFLTTSRALANATGPKPRQVGLEFEAGGIRVQLYSVRAGGRSVGSRRS